MYETFHERGELNLDIITDTTIAAQESAISGVAHSNTSAMTAEALITAMLRKVSANTC